MNKKNDPGFHLAHPVHILSRATYNPYLIPSMSLSPRNLMNDDLEDWRQNVTCSESSSRSSSILQDQTSSPSPTPSHLRIHLNSPAPSDTDSSCEVPDYEMEAATVKAILTCLFTILIPLSPKESLSPDSISAAHAEEKLKHAYQSRYLLRSAARSAERKWRHHVLAANTYRSRMLLAKLRFEQTHEHVGKLRFLLCDRRIAEKIQPGAIPSARQMLFGLAPMRSCSVEALPSTSGQQGAKAIL